MGLNHVNIEDEAALTTTDETVRDASYTKSSFEFDE
jgi:hypothetical protein